ncbi:MAG TPA: hypothetical protein PLF17_06125 [Chitinophagaceae bacterium]|nr:hypothetical protein [Chitinophagaceae bacterium]
MKYKIWDRINKRHDESKYIDKDGVMRDLSIFSFDRDDFEVQFIFEAGDDVVDSKIFEIKNRIYESNPVINKFD